MKNYEDLTGRQFNKWLVIEMKRFPNGSLGWLCECQCENKTRQIIVSTNLKKGRTKSCGCEPRPTQAKDLTGQKFGKLLVLKQEKSKKNSAGKNIARWLCQCDCGSKPKVINAGALTSGNTKSCGCLQHRKTLNPDSKTRLYEIWCGMIKRVENANSYAYEYYGERGITICDKWRNDFNSFKEWALNNGYEEDLTIDRIDNDGNYEPLNCRWATAKEQANNKSNTVVLTYNGTSKTLSEWSEYLNVDRNLLHDRYYSGWSVERLLTEPKINKTIRLKYKNQTKTLKEWADIIGISKSTLKNRYDKGWTVEEILTTPLQRIKKENMNE